MFQICWLRDMLADSLTNCTGGCENEAAINYLGMWPEAHHVLQFHEKTALWAVTAMRSSFDLITGYGPGRMNEGKWLQRIVFLETVAGVPGMVGGMVSVLRRITLKAASLKPYAICMLEST